MATLCARCGLIAAVAFAAQEELAFVFEMLQQFEDALVQYDELDALFTQYVLNFGAGGTWAGLPMATSSPYEFPVRGLNRAQRGGAFQLASRARLRESDLALKSSFGNEVSQIASG